jgi:hypothetical protein
MTEVNELEKEKHMQMSMVEFYEGLARIADKLSIDSL